MVKLQCILTCMLSSYLLIQGKYSVEPQFLFAQSSLPIFPYILSPQVCECVCVIFKMLSRNVYSGLTFLTESNAFKYISSLLFLVSSLFNFLFVISDIKNLVTENTASEAKRPVFKCWFCHLLTICS